MKIKVVKQISVKQKVDYKLYEDLLVEYDVASIVSPLLSSDSSFIWGGNLLSYLFKYCKSSQENIHVTYHKQYLDERAMFGRIESKLKKWHWPTCFTAGGPFCL